jgi:hypothetical protein
MRAPADLGRVLAEREGTCGFDHREEIRVSYSPRGCLGRGREAPHARVEAIMACEAVGIDQAAQRDRAPLPVLEGVLERVREEEANKGTSNLYWRTSFR